MEHIETFDAIVVGDKDNVAIVLKPIPKDTRVVVKKADAFFTVVAVNDIPYGHKILLEDAPSGTLILKYSEKIGSLTADCRKGMHIHTHNMCD